MTVASTEPLVRFEKVTKRFLSGEAYVDVLRNVDLAIGRGEFVVVLGVSGSGKTTLLNLMGAIDRPTTGRVLVDGKEISSATERERTTYRRDKVGFIFQFYNLLPTLVAVENVEAGLEILPLSREDVAERSRRYLTEVGLGDKLEKLPAQLSGGEQQRVAVARALLQKPDLVLADEPTGNLDTHTGESLFGLLRDLNRTRKTTFVIVTHNDKLSAQSDRIIHMQDGMIV